MQDGREYEVIEPVDRNKDLANELVGLKLKKIQGELQNRLDCVILYLPDLLSIRKYIDKEIRDLEQITGQRAK